jgi:hypothetical protein
VDHGALANEVAAHARRVVRVASKSHVDCLRCATDEALVLALCDVLWRVQHRRAWRGALSALLALVVCPRGETAPPLEAHRAKLPPNP